MKTETFDDKEAFLAAVQGKKPRPPAKDARPDLPRAAAGIDYEIARDEARGT